jgi:hypothetical protein
VRGPWLREDTSVNSDTWTSNYTNSTTGLTYTLSTTASNTNTIKMAFTIDPETDPQAHIEEPCPDCERGTITIDGDVFVCGACDGSGVTYHLRLEERPNG